ncbi:MAG TPA: hypothetical protein VN661_05215 [Candidatus Acidoferrales bacterium]|nr:hypothetical protein [Candidatus Acidoferrales bacterium]
MNLDIRLPIGLMFGLFGVMLVIFGLVSDPRIYAQSLGVNINLWWGIALCVFGAIMLWLGWRGGARSRASSHAPGAGGDERGGDAH